MALVLKDRVKETTTTTGTGTYTLAGAVAGFEAFSEIGNSNTTYYCCTDGTDFEVGIGTYTASGTTLARTTILQSSNSDAAVNWTSGNRTIFCTQPAEKAVFLDGSGNISIPGTIDGRDLATDGSKLDGIEASATADQTASEIRALVESASDSNVFTDADHTKLNGIEASADVTDTTNVTAAGALMDSEVTNLAQVKAFDSSDYATAAQGTTADAALPKAGGIMTGNITLNNANLRFEGSTADANETTLTVADPSADRTITLPDATGQVVLSDGAIDTEASAEIGRAHIGAMGHSDFAGFSHIDQNGTGSYALLQHSGGGTHLNAASGNSINFNINNTNVMNMDNTGLYFYSGKVIAFEGSTEDTNETTLTVADPTADRTITLPDATGTVVLQDSNNDVILVSSDAGSGFDPILRFDRRSTSPADFDNLGAVEFVGRNSADETIFYSTISGMADDITDGTEDGRVRIATVSNGSQVSHTDFTPGALELRNEQVIRFYLQNGSFNTEILGGTPTANRTITLPDATGTVQLTDGSGASLTSLNASQLSSGTVPNARLDQQLQDVAGLAVTNGNFIVGDGSNFVAESGATARASLGLGTAATSATGDFATAAQGTTADAAMPKAGGTFTGDVTFTGANYNIVFDKSDDALEFADNAKATFGASGDLQIFHSGSNSAILDSGTGNLIIGANDFQLTNSGITENYIKAFSNGAVELYYDNSKKLETTADGVRIISTDAGSGAGPLVTLSRDSSSPADSDQLGRIEFRGENDADEDIQYALITAKLLDNTDGTEDGGLNFAVMQGGSENSVRISLQGFGDTVFSNQDIRLNTGVDLKFEGATANTNETTLTVTDPTADRTITLPDATGTVLLTDGSGASLTSLNASQLSSGTVPNARLDAQLQDVAGLAVTNGGFIVGDGSNFVLETGSTARTSLGLGSIATQASNNVSITGGSVSGITDLAIADGGTGASSASAARTNLGLGTAAVAATGISNGNVPVFTSGVADNDFLRVNGTSIEGRSASELASDIGASTTDDATALAIALG